LDIVLYPNDPERIKIIDRMFNKEPTGRKKNLFMIHEVFLDDSKLPDPDNPKNLNWSILVNSYGYTTWS